MFILNKVTLLYNSLMILERYWWAFISLAARDRLSSLHGVVHAACVEVEYVYFHDTCVLPCMELTYR
jgi:hypothetical protein